MKLALASQMKLIDEKTQTEFGFSGDLLMERAALAAAGVLEELHPDFKERRIHIYCGKGNNGGDGLALARILHEKRVKVTAILMAASEEYHGLALDNLKRAVIYGVKLIQWNRREAGESAKADLIVDALLGTGSRGVPEGPVAAAIKTINNSGKPVLALDLPSGTDPDTGQAQGEAVRAEATVTFGLAKPGLLCYPGAGYAGKVIVAAIGFPKQLLEAEGLKLNSLTPTEAADFLPERPATAHKGTCGRLLIIGGAPGMTGALALASRGALRTGAGLVTVGLRDNLPFPEKPAEVMTVTWEEAMRRIKKFDGIVVGPGMGTAVDGKELLKFVFQNSVAPLVIDADGLNLIAAAPELFDEIRTSLVLTPHPGEMARLIGKPVAAIQEDRIKIAARFALDRKAVLILKGARSIIALPEGNIYINTTGNPGMATAGMGDVLAGMIGGLIGQGLSVATAGVVGTYLHGLAGDLAAERKGPVGLLAGDLIEAIPAALKKVWLK